MTTTSFLGDKPVNRIGFGAMQLAGPGVFGPPRDPDAARAVLRRADRARRRPHRHLAVLRPRRRQRPDPRDAPPLSREPKLVTKVGARRDDAGGWLPGARPDELRAGVEANLRSLRVERMDLVNLRLLGDDGGAGRPAARAARRARGHAPGGQARPHRRLQRDARGRRAGARPRRARRGAERLQRRRPRATSRSLELCRERGHRLRAVLPARLGVHRRAEQLAADPAIAGVAEKHGATPVAGRAGVAAARATTACC